MSEDIKVVKDYTEQERMYSHGRSPDRTEVRGLENYQKRDEGGRIIGGYQFRLVLDEPMNVERKQRDFGYEVFHDDAKKVSMPYSSGSQEDDVKRIQNRACNEDFILMYRPVSERDKEEEYYQKVRESQAEASQKYQGPGGKSIVINQTKKTKHEIRSGR